MPGAHENDSLVAKGLNYLLLKISMLVKTTLKLFAFENMHTNEDYLLTIYF